MVDGEGESQLLITSPVIESILGIMFLVNWWYLNLSFAVQVRVTLDNILCNSLACYIPDPGFQISGKSSKEIKACNRITYIYIYPQIWFLVSHKGKKKIDHDSGFGLYMVCASETRASYVHKVTLVCRSNQERAKTRTTKLTSLETQRDEFQYIKLSNQMSKTISFASV